VSLFLSTTSSTSSSSSSSSSSSFDFVIYEKKGKKKKKKGEKKHGRYSNYKQLHHFDVALSGPCNVCTHLGNNANVELYMY
jgi:hypothetical protein